PQVVVVMPCGYDAERSHEEARAYASELAALGAGRVVAVDASAYFSRPGPRLIDGLELLARALHPAAFSDPPPAGRLLAVELDASANAVARARQELPSLRE
ncbi:MAG TPA: hypothetical protein VNY34_03595, partial [Solirubrobacteraceae bacterium]|nr:hypothetical protein [Solirubrobacteraceae bacterium]